MGVKHCNHMSQLSGAYNCPRWMVGDLTFSHAAHAGGVIVGVVLFSFCFVFLRSSGAADTSCV